MNNLRSYLDFLNEKKPAGAPDFHHSDAPDANGRFKELGIKDGDLKIPVLFDFKKNT